MYHFCGQFNQNTTKTWQVHNRYNIISVSHAAKNNHFKKCIAQLKIILMKDTAEIYFLQHDQI